MDPIGLEAWSSVATFQVIIAGLDPAIHRLAIDARVEPAHDLPL